MSHAIAESGQWATFFLANEQFAVPVEEVQEVLLSQPLTPVPLAPCEILGLVNLRGKIVTAVSLRRRLHGDPTRRETSNLAIGMEHRGESFALVVDEVGDVITLDLGTRIPVPSHLGAEEIKISAVHRLESLILPLLDLDWVFTFSRGA